VFFTSKHKSSAIIIFEPAIFLNASFWQRQWNL
jgi:hypothetical protein